MPYSVNGIGTGLIDASKRRMISAGHTQFDAVEAVQFLFCPIVPYKVVHVLSFVEAGVERHSYRCVPLRPSLRLIGKAFLRAWGNAFLFAGGTMTPILGILFATMSRPVRQDDYIFLAVFGAMLLVGAALRLFWLFMCRTDERIKDMIGPHELGRSDPFCWPRETAEAVREAILRRESLPSLADVARRAIAAGDFAKGMLCVRLAMHDPRDAEAQELFWLLIRRKHRTGLERVSTNT